jgi:hypothetical protein
MVSVAQLVNMVNKQQVVVILLVIAIVLSAFNLMISLGIDDVLVPAGSGQTGGDSGDVGGGIVSLYVGEPGGNS